MRATVKIFIVILMLAMAIPVNASNTIEWYCKRRNDHSQPTIDSCLSDAENYNGFIWIDKEHSSYDSDEKVIYLTFDVGYENGNVEKIMNIMKEENVKGTFFILENVISKNKDLVKRMIDEGHLIGNHTCRHKNMSKVADIELFRRELEGLENLYKDTFNIDMPKYYRPPEGKLSIDNLMWAEKLGYKTVMWSFAYADWDNGSQPSEEAAFKKIMDNIHNGEIMLLHPTSSTNVKILKRVIKELKDEGYSFGRVDEIKL